MKIPLLESIHSLNALVQRLLTGLVLGLLFWTLFVWLPPIYFSGILFLILCIIIAFEWTRLFCRKGWTFWLLIPFYPILPFALLIAMNQHPIYHSLLFILFILVSSFDTGSYFVGTFIGYHPIMPRISPKKTWEGVLGGFIFAYIGLWLVLWELGKLQSWEVMIIFTIIVCLLSLMGDLLESWFKRRAGIKDSGRFLPGHGGFLDRFDGILFTVFFFYIFKYYLVWLFDL